MKYLLVLGCLSLFCCSDDNATESNLSTTDAAASNAEAGVSKPVNRDQDAHDRDANAPVTVRDSAVALADSGSPGTDAGAATDARVASDAGTDASTGDAAYGGASRCTGSGLAFCDDFEGTQLDPAWQDKQGTLELDGTRPAMRGQKSLHVHTENNKAAIMAHRASFPMPNERFWLRMFVNIKNLPAPNWAHWSIMWASPEGQPWSVVEHRLGGQNQSDKKLYWAVGSDHGSSGDWTNIDTSSTVSLDRWQCIEVLIDSNQDISQVYRDGVEIVGLGTTRSTKHAGNSSVPYDIPPIRTLWVGFFYYQGETPGQSYDLWIDSLALDGERIGCAR